MKNLILFSDYFKPIANKIKFVAIVIGRFFRIVLRRRKHIQLLQLEYSTKYLFDKSFLIIQYRFKNALWYDFKNLKRTTEKKSVVFNITNINTSTIVLIVHGFLQKKVYHLAVQPDNILITNSFQPNIFNINKKINFIPLLKLLVKKPTIKIPKIRTKRKDIIINHSPYNQTELL